MISFLRQLKYPKEYRIPAPGDPDAIWESTDLLVNFMLGPQRDEREWHRLLREIGTGLWRIKSRLEGEKNPSSEVQRAMRFLDSTWDALNQAGLEIQDHTNQFISGGESLRILTYETVRHLQQDQVIETIKPTIYYKGTIIQIGEVIVGTASESQPNPKESNVIAL
ncbi:MAG: hypothetical protein RBU29_17565 [bacterium]|jgi:hypothetical protein|nr:hypothetical protein [bacterium]